MRSAAVLALAAVAAAAVQKYDSSLNMTIDANSVDESTRAGWCRAQSDSCHTLCDDDDSTNDCDYTDLSYDCICGSNNSAPGLQYYSQTLPTFICTQLFETCISQNTGSATDQEACTKNIGDLCGHTPPSQAAKSSSSSSTAASASSSSTASATESASSATATSDNDGGNAAPAAGPHGLAAVGVAAAVAGAVAALV